MLSGFTFKNDTFFQDVNVEVVALHKKIRGELYTFIKLASYNCKLIECKREGKKLMKFEGR